MAALVGDAKICCCSSQAVLLLPLWELLLLLLKFDFIYHVGGVTIFALNIYISEYSHFPSKG